MMASVCLCFGPGHTHAEGQVHVSPPGLEAVAAEFPTVAFHPDADVPVDAQVIVRADSWQRGEIDLYDFDHQIDELAGELAGHGRVTVRVVGGDVARVALQVLTRCQRRVGRRNVRSQSHAFDRVLALHRELHDLQKPLVRADYNHALDVWQWMLRLCPEAGAAVQIAALFHDIERLVSEADARVEHLAPHYDAFKQTHAHGGADLSDAHLAALGLATVLRERLRGLIEKHERRPAGASDDPDLALLNDADALSFFSLNSGSFLDYYGQAHTRKKIAWTLTRMSTRAHARLGEIWLRPDVAGILRDIRGEAASALPDRESLPGSAA